MPQLANAKKALRQANRRADRNKVRLEEIHSLRRKLRKLVDGGKLDEVKDVVKTLDQKIDKAVKKNLLKLNKGSRIKSRYMAKVNAAQSAVKK